ncbi:MAG: LPXTG cell wall anchor domain-containing protein, partial [Erysipelotrichaceae bacterium]|nr:LPXTG cell wall anchor domain-containing protein [Erysipelotrichaceae bacterium]
TFNWKTSSVYAIGYADTKDPAPTPDPTPTPTPSDSTTPTTPTKTTTPASSSSKTAAETNFAFWAGLMAAGVLLTALLGFAFRRKK